MKLEEVYAVIGGNYNEVLGRLRKESLLLKYVQKFPSETMMQEMVVAINADKVDDAFHLAHSLNGICKNLSIGRYGEAIEAVTEELRAGNLDNAKAMLPKVQEEYDITCNAIKEIE